MYMRLLRDWGPARVGTYAFISPIVAVLLGALVFHERLMMIEALGMLAMLAGAWLSLVPKRPSHRASELRIVPRDNA
jgi:drug/metabolite transporter (DMT)-like permease